ncbi:MAG: TrkA family potassium uptake protein, partial [Spirochaetales bacterium]|nr:TrkA family potassium uptake protein [Spirochaetales bacterium]
MSELQTVAVLGLGTFGQSLCRALKRADVEVIAVDHIEEHVNAIRDVVDRAVIGDVTDPAVLDEAGLRACECVVIAIGENTESNVIATLNVQDMGIESIYARAMSRTHRRILEKLGITTMFNPEQDAAARLAATIAHSGIERLVELDDGFSFVVVDAPSSFPGRSLQQLDVRRRYGI